MTRGLTEKQERILNFILEYVGDKGYPPSIREIGVHFNISSLRGVTVHLDALERKGYIKRSNTARAITVIGKTGSTSPARNVTFVSLIGTIAAGIPISANQTIGAQIPVPPEMLSGGGNIFALEVKGDSMIEAHIMPKDVVVVKEQRTAQNGDLVAFLLGDEATIKHIQFLPDCIRLMPANAAYDPIEVRSEESQIIGKVIGLIRNYDGGLSF